MSWSETFAAHLAARGISQLDAVVELRSFDVRASQSQAHYWCRGSVPRLATRQKIETWSDGAVPALAADVASSPDLESDESGEHAATPAPKPSRSNTA